MALPPSSGQHELTFSGHSTNILSGRSARLSRLQIDGEHRAGWSNSLGKPCRYRAATGTDFETAPARPDTRGFQLFDGERPVKALKQRQPLALRLAAVC
jgi:hypothetical protein